MALERKGVGSHEQRGLKAKSEMQSPDLRVDTPTVAQERGNERRWREIETNLTRRALCDKGASPDRQGCSRTGIHRHPLMGAIKKLTQLFSLQFVFVLFPEAVTYREEVPGTLLI